MIKIELSKLDSDNQEVLFFDKTDLLIGRSTKNDIVINDSTVSRMHLLVFINNDQLYCKDLESSHGSKVYIDDKNEWVSIDGLMTLNNSCQLKIANTYLLKVSIVSEKGVIEESMFNDNVSVIQSISGSSFNASIAVIDICDSTAIAYRDNKLAYHIKKRTECFVNEICKKFNSIFVKNTGDGYLLIFQSPTDALNASTTLLDLISERNLRTKNELIKIRVGLHHGSICYIGSDIDVHGSDINLAFRIEGVSKENLIEPICLELPKEDRIVCSENFAKLIDEKQLKVNIGEVGYSKLKGIDKPIKLLLISKQHLNYLH